MNTSCASHELIYLVPKVFGDFRINSYEWEWALYVRGKKSSWIGKLNSGKFRVQHLVFGSICCPDWTELKNQNFANIKTGLNRITQKTEPEET